MGIRMKSNINRKYLHRRKNWFQRNWGYLLFWLIIIVVVAGVLYGVFYLLPKYRGVHDSIDDGKQSQQAEASSVEEMSTRTVTWHDLKEEEVKTASVYTVDYTVPEGVAYPYYIKVNRVMNCVTVYGMDANGQYTIPVRAMVASVGGDDTLLGEDFRTTYYYDWRSSGDTTYGMYVSRINYNNLFSSVLYHATANDRMDTAGFNGIGSSASVAGVYLCARDAKWIYDNCPAGTGVTVYDDATTAGPLGKPEMIKVPENSEYAGWDPTDPVEGNPWRNSSAVITGTKDITVAAGNSVNLLSGVKATDTCGNDITGSIQVVGKYTLDQAGSYTIKYVVTDLLGSRAETEIKLYVTE